MVELVGDRHDPALPGSSRNPHGDVGSDAKASSLLTASVVFIEPSAKTCHSASFGPFSVVTRPAFFVRSGTRPFSSARILKGRLPPNAAITRA